MSLYNNNRFDDPDAAYDAMWLFNGAVLTFGREVRVAVGFDEALAKEISEAKVFGFPVEEIWDGEIPLIDGKILKVISSDVDEVDEDVYIVEAHVHELDAEGNVLLCTHIPANWLEFNVADKSGFKKEPRPNLHIPLNPNINGFLN